MKRIVGILKICDRRILRYIAGVTLTWEDGLRSEEMAERCGVETSHVLLRRMSLRRLGHVRTAARGKGGGRRRASVVGA